MTSAPNGERVSPRRARLLALASLVGGWFAFFAPELLGPGLPYLRDNLLTYLPLRQHLHERLSAGELPQWYPYEALGVPLIGQVAVGTFHPATWLLVPLPFALAVKLNLLFCYLAAAVGGYRFCRELRGTRPASVTAAFAYAFGGYALGLSSLLPYAMSMATLPWVAWALWRTVRRRRPSDAAVLALTLALVFLAGDPQGLFCCLALVPIALLGSLRALPEEGVVGAATVDGSAGGSMASTPSAGGIRAASTALAWLAVAGTLAGLLVAVEFLPAQVSFAESVRVRGSPTPDIRSYWALHPLRLFELVTPGFLRWPLEPGVLAQVTGGRVSSAFVTTAFAGALPLWLAALGAFGKRREAYGFLALGLLAVVPALVWVELWNGNHPHLPLGPPELLAEPNPLAEAVRSARPSPHAPAPRVFTELAFPPESPTEPDPTAKLVRSKLALLPDAAGLEQVNALGPRLGAFSMRYAFLVGAATEHAKARAAWLNACFRVGAGLEPSERAVLAVPSAGLVLAERPCGPRAWLSSTAGVENPRAALEWLRQHRPEQESTPEAEREAKQESEQRPETEREPRSESVVWEGGPSLPAARGRVSWVRHEPEHLTLDVEAEAPTGLIIADELSPGWTATLDGQDVPLYPTLLALRGVAVPAGAHRVELRYRTPRLSAGLLLSGLGLLGVAALGLGGPLAARWSAARRRLRLERR